MPATVLVGIPHIRCSVHIEELFKRKYDPPPLNHRVGGKGV